MAIYRFVYEMQQVNDKTNKHPGVYKQLPIIVPTTLHPISVIGFESVKPVIKREYSVKNNDDMKESPTN